MNRKSKFFIKIGAIAYNLGWKHRPRLNGKFVVGLIDYNGQTIDTYVGLQPTVEWINIWHEVLHAILNNAGINDHNEDLLNILAHGICNVLAENPSIHAPLSSAERAEPEDEDPETPLEEELHYDARTD